MAIFNPPQYAFHKNRWPLDLTFWLKKVAEILQVNDPVLKTSVLLALGIWVFWNAGSFIVKFTTSWALCPSLLTVRLSPDTCSRPLSTTSAVNLIFGYCNSDCLSLKSTGFFSLRQQKMSLRCSGRGRQNNYFPKLGPCLKQKAVFKGCDIEKFRHYSSCPREMDLPAVSGGWMYLRCTVCVHVPLPSLTLSPGGCLSR